jgi:PAS domain S-box-containing protein
LITGERHAAPLSLLIVDDEPANLLVLEAVLGDLGANLVRAGSGAEALRRVLEMDFALVLLDVHMPDMNGLETARLLRGRQRSEHIPVLFLTAHATAPRWTEEAYELGAVDFLTKPFSPAVLRAKVSVFVELFRHRQQEHQRAEAALREQKERTAELSKQQTLLQAVLDNVTDAIVACDADGVLSLFNRAAQEFHGLPARPVASEDWADQYSLYTPDGSMPLRPEEIPLLRALRGERVQQVEMVIAPRGGEVRNVLASGQRLVDPEGFLLGAVVSMQDIGERKRRQEAVAQVAREQERSDSLRRVAAASRAMSAVLHADTIVGMLTAEARSIVGAHVAVTSLAAEEEPARILHTFDVSAEHSDSLPALQQAHAGLYPLVQDGRAPAGWLSVPLVGYGGQTLGFLQLSDKAVGQFTVEDEAVLVQLAATAAACLENARLYQRLQDQDRRKDEFLATLAHELRNPLAPVRHGLEILRLSKVSLEGAEKVRQMMERQLGHMVHLVDDLLDVSRVTSGKITLQRERVELRAVVQAAVETSRPGLEAGRHELWLELPPEPLWLEVDPTRLAQVLTNLLHNAAKYTPAGGQVWVRAVREGGQVVVSVEDTGVGLPKEMLTRIFDMFTQVGASLDRAQGGLGIGLTLVRKLVEMHGGTVKAASPGPGQGSTFFLRLPLLTLERAPTDPGLVRDEPGPAVGRRILVVDDNVDGAESLSLLLSLGGHEVRTAHTGPLGLEAARTFRPEVVFLDIGLPEMNGYEVVRRLRLEPELQALVVVALTGWGSEEDRRRARQAGFDHHLTKPIEPERVSELLARL